MRMKSAMGSLMMAAAMMGGMGGLGPFGTSRGREYDPTPEPATDAQRRMFKHPVKLNKKQKAKRKANNF